MPAESPPKERFLHSPGRIYCFADTVEGCQSLLAAGARVIQLRHKTIDDTGFRQLARQMLACTRRFADAVLIVNDRVDIALQVGADGVHVGQADKALHRFIGRVPPEMIVGVSARYPDLARAAEAAGATYVGCGSIAATPTKPDAVVIGLDGLRAVTAAVAIPVVAIGGISQRNLQAVLAAGARYCAIISEINAAPDPAAAYRHLEALAVFPPHQQSGRH